MGTYEIFWDDLTEDAQERLKDLWHDNVEFSPLAIIEVEEEEDLIELEEDLI
jgi:hypothetical protein